MLCIPLTIDLKTSRFDITEKWGTIPDRAPLSETRDPPGETPRPGPPKSSSGARYTGPLKWELGY